MLELGKSEAVEMLNECLFCYGARRAARRLGELKKKRLRAPIDLPGVLLLAMTARAEDTERLRTSSVCAGCRQVRVQTAASSAGVVMCCVLVFRMLELELGKIKAMSKGMSFLLRGPGQPLGELKKNGLRAPIVLLEE